MGRPLALFGLGISLALIVPAILHGDFTVAPEQAALVMLALTTVCIVGLARKQAVRLKREVKTRRVVSRSEAGTDCALRLMGDYPPYVIEAAQELSVNRTSDAAALLERAIERMIEEHPPGWREMSGAMAEALGKIGDQGSMPLLCRLRDTPGADEIVTLPAVIDSLQSASHLLRPADKSEASLLRPTRSYSADEDPDQLLRASADDLQSQ